MALSCSINKSILKTTSCGYSLQSVQDVFLANRADVTKVERTIGTGGTCSQEIASITLAPEAKWSHFQVAKNTASFADTLTKLDNGGSYRTHSLSFSIANAYSPEMVCIVDGLSLGNFIGVARLASGNFVMLGSENVGLEATTVTNQGAASSSDFSGIQVELSADLGETSSPLSAEAIEELLGNVYEG